MAGERDSSAAPPAAAEGVDLPLELQRELVALDDRLDRLTHYEILGVAWGASVAEARAAYLSLVRRFHPDRYGGRRLGAFAERLQRISARLAVARDVLSDDALRAAYEERTAPPEEVARRRARAIDEELRAEERRARLQRTNPMVLRAGRVAGLLKRGRELAAEGKHAQAVNDFMTVLVLDPRHPEAQSLAAESRRRLAAESARELYEDGLRHEAAGRDEAALDRFSRAAELSRSDHRPAVAAVHAAVRLGRAAEAVELARAATRAAPRAADAHAALGAALGAAGERGEARKALDRALELDPAHEIARTLRKAMRWSPFR